MPRGIISLAREKKMQQDCSVIQKSLNNLRLSKIPIAKKPTLIIVKIGVKLERKNLKKINNLYQCILFLNIEH